MSAPEFSIHFHQEQASEKLVWVATCTKPELVCQGPTIPLVLERMAQSVRTAQYLEAEGFTD